MLSYLFSFAAISGLLSVVMGAFGAHYLKDKLSEVAIHGYETAVLYQMFHTLVLLVIGLLIIKFPNEPFLKWAAWSIISGIVMFSGSLYLLSISGYKIFGPVTPLGGLAFILGWFFLGLAAWRSF